MAGRKIQVAVLEDHPAIVDGFRFRLQNAPDIEIVAVAGYGKDLEPILARYPADVLLLDVRVPANAENPNPYPILHLIPRLLDQYPDLHILIISMYAQRTLIHTLMDAGVNGYMLKDDRTAMETLAAIIRLVAGGGVYLSDEARQQLLKRKPADLVLPLSPRQLEALSLCAAYPDDSTKDLARRMGIEHSTCRTLLSGAYLKLGVSSKAAAIAKAYQLGLAPSEPAVLSGQPEELGNEKP